VVVLLAGARSFAETKAGRCEPTSSLIVQEVHLTGSPSVGSDEAHSITSPLIGVCFSRNDSDPLRERLRDAFQTHGFFNAKIADLRLDVTNSLQHPAPVVVYAGIEAGPKYRVGEIIFNGQKAISNLDVLRNQIPLSPGDVFDTEKTRQGIRNLRDVYLAAGYLNFTPVPDTEVDDIRQTVNVKFDLDEGGQFSVAHVDIIAPAEVGERLSESWPLKVGDVYNSRLVRWFFDANKDLIPAAASPEQNIQTTQDRNSGTVAIRVDVCPPNRACSAYVVPCRPDRACLHQ